MSNFDTMLRNGLIYDGSGSDPYIGNIAIKGDKIVKVGQVEGFGDTEIDVAGLLSYLSLFRILSIVVEDVSI